jgi:predicted  nucleic acid-binding Zn-ribbon protein
MSQSFKLFRVQQIDSLLDRARLRLKEIDIALHDEAALRQAQTTMAEAEQEYQDASRALHRAEQDVQSQNIKIEQTEATLYGGKVRNPKELQDLQNESAALKRYLAVLEDRQLEAMLVLEVTEAQLQSAKTYHEECSAQSAAENARLTNEKSTLEKDIGRQELEKQAASSGIPDSDLRLYEQLRKQRNGVAVARVIDRTCSACGSTLSAALYSAAQSPNQISRCETCGRILYAG